MAAPGKPRHRSGYSREETEQVEVVKDALGRLARDFADPETLGPRRVAEFEGEAGEDGDAIAADAHGYVDDLLKACAQSGLWRASKQDRGETL